MSTVQNRGLCFISRSLGSAVLSVRKISILLIFLSVGIGCTHLVTLYRHHHVGKATTSLGVWCVDTDQHPYLEPIPEASGAPHWSPIQVLP